MKKTAFMTWVDDQLAADPHLAQAVDDLVGEMKLEQQIVALREKRGLTQRGLAELLGTSQPYVAKLESGRVKNLGVLTLVKCARALGASVTIRMEAANPRLTRSATPAHRRSAVARAISGGNAGLARGTVELGRTIKRLPTKGTTRSRRGGS